MHRGACAILVLAAACAPEAATFSIVDARESPLLWLPDEGRALRQPTVLGDLDSDGYADASVISWVPGDDWFEWDLHVIRGPLTGIDRVPEEAARTTEGVILASGNLFDNGGSDVALGDREVGIAVDGTDLLELDPWLVGQPLRSTLLDVDGDGILDEVGAAGRGEIGVWYGPASRWGEEAEPDLVLRFPCDDEDALAFVGGLTVLPDVTGDGRHEAFSLGWIYADAPSPSTTCLGYTFTMPEGDGAVDVPAIASPARGFVDAPTWAVVPDQTGDGRPDLLTGTHILAAPVRFEASGAPASDARVRTCIPGLERLAFLGHDATGDGEPDFLGYLGSTLLLIPGGPEAGHTRCADRGWAVGEGVLSPRAESAFVEGGVTWLLVDLGGTIAVVELGPSGA